MTIRNPYEPLTEEDLKRKLEADELLEKQFKRTADQVRKCLAHPAFDKYKKLYREYEKEIIATLKANQEPDPVKFALFAKACLAKLDGISMLLDLVETDEKKLKRHAE